MASMTSGVASGNGAAHFADLPRSKIQAGRLGNPSATFLSELAYEQITGYVVEVTPELARQWLECNDHNRRLRVLHVAGLAVDIRERRWRTTHQGIAFSKDGRLIDGQHRLGAIIEAKMPAFLTVFIDLDDDMFGALDRGARRTVADELLEDRRAVDPCNWLVDLLKAGSRVAPTPSEVRTVLDIYRPEVAAIAEAAGSTAKGRTSAPVKGALMVRLKDATGVQRKLQLDQWKAFVNLDVTEMDLTTGALLKRLENVSGSGGGKTTRDERGVVAWIGFNPRSRGLSKIIIRDISRELAEIRSVTAAQIRA